MVYEAEAVRLTLAMHLLLTDANPTPHPDLHGQPSGNNIGGASNLETRPLYYEKASQAMTTSTPQTHIGNIT
jgi:hypothetical protein